MVSALKGGYGHSPIRSLVGQFEGCKVYAKTIGKTSTTLVGMMGNGTWKNTLSLGVDLVITLSVYNIISLINT